MKKIFLLLSLLPAILLAQPTYTTFLNSSYCRITEAYYIRNDSSVIVKDYVDTSSGILFMPVKKDSIIISIDRGGIDKVYFLGHAIRISNPGIDTNREGGEFYYWKFATYVFEGTDHAYVFKEQLTGSLEERGKRYYFIDVIFFNSKHPSGAVTWVTHDEPTTKKVVEESKRSKK